MTVKFAKENFDFFNFPKKNTDSFTVAVENHLADMWQECFERLFGKPIVNKNKATGTESGRVSFLQQTFKNKEKQIFSSRW